MIALGVAVYLGGILLSMIRLVFYRSPEAAYLVSHVLWYSGIPTSVGLALVATDLALLLPFKRRGQRLVDITLPSPREFTVALTSYNDEASVGDAVRDFLSQPTVRKVIVVDNNSTDRSAQTAANAGAIVVSERQPGYGRCAYRCLQELYAQSDTEYVVLCEGDLTFRARDIEKLSAYARHADIVNGTRIVEQLRSYDTQLSTFMYYGNFFVGKLLEIKHLGRGTFTDVGTTYKILRRDILPHLLAELDPSINLEFNAHFMDRALATGHSLLECPITFHPRVGASKGGNASNRRALKVGVRMILGLLTNWRSRPLVGTR
jgi:glycosyltransferase involved in cell wall biosynthesis